VGVACSPPAPHALVSSVNASAGVRIEKRFIISDWGSARGRAILSATVPIVLYPA
jgi:hypothetical protein